MTKPKQYEPERKEFEKEFVDPQGGWWKVKEKFPHPSWHSPEDVFTWITQVFAKRVERKTIGKMIELSNEIESQGIGGNLGEWRGFKRFRNTMREELKKDI